MLKRIYNEADEAITVCCTDAGSVENKLNYALGKLREIRRLAAKEL